MLKCPSSTLGLGAIVILGQVIQSNMGQIRLRWVCSVRNGWFSKQVPNIRNFGQGGGGGAGVYCWKSQPEWRRVRPKIRHLAPLDGCACAFAECLRRTKSTIIAWHGSFITCVMICNSTLSFWLFIPIYLHSGSCKLPLLYCFILENDTL